MSFRSLSVERSWPPSSPAIDGATYSAPLRARISAPLRTLGLMNNRAVALFLASGTLAFWSPAAHAQKIPWIVLPLAASPVLAVLLSAALGIATKSWSVGLGNTALVMVWVVWFLAASSYSTYDLVVWASVLALGLHSFVMVCFIVLHAFRRANARREA